MDALKALQSLGLGPEATGPDGEKLLQQAQQIWSMLDDMADKDPQAYSRFIEKQKKEHEQLAAPPQPHMCVQTQLQSLKSGLLFINIVSWPRIPKPKSAEDNIPLYAAPLDSFQDKKTGDTVSTVTVATNPEVLAQYGLDAKNERERRSFIDLTLDYIQHLCGTPVQRNFTLLPRNTNFKGDLEKAQKFFTNSLKQGMAKKDTRDNEDTTAVPDTDMDIPDSMLFNLANISSATNKSNQSNSGTSGKLASDGPIRLLDTENAKQPANKKGLIEELDSQEVAMKKPKFTLDRSPSGDELVLRVELPDVTSVSQCQLDISEDDVKLYVEGKYDLTVKLTSRIDDCEARAKFNKKLSALILHMPVARS